MSSEISTQRGRVLGGTLLVTGSCIGSAMLGLPVITGPAGFGPSTVMFLLAWCFMVSTGLLLLEVNLWYGPGVSIISMAHNTLGNTGRWIAGLTFGFLFYSLMIAILSGTSEIILAGFREYLGVQLIPWQMSLLLALVFGVLVYLGTQMVDYVNRLFMLGIIIGYVVLLVAGWKWVDPQLLKHSDWKAALMVMPVMVISFGYHNLIPSLTRYLDGRSRDIVTTILVGSLITLGVNLLWDWLVLGIIPVQGPGGILDALEHGRPATELLRSSAGVGTLSAYTDLFAFSAMITTLVGVGLSFLHFLQDGFKDRGTEPKKWILCLLVILPPFVISQLYPEIFLTALNYAGGFGVVILFGILPVWMVWKGRYQLGMTGTRFLPGGRVSLIIILIIAIAIMGLELAQELGLSLLPPTEEALP